MSVNCSTGSLPVSPSVVMLVAGLVAGRGCATERGAGANSISGARRYHIASMPPAMNHAVHAAINIGGTSASNCSSLSAMALRDPREGVAASERIFGQQCLEDRRACALARHRLAQGLIDVGVLVVIEHENDHDAALI